MPKKSKSKLFPKLTFFESVYTVKRGFKIDFLNTRMGFVKFSGHPKKFCYTIKKLNFCQQGGVGRLSSSNFKWMFTPNNMSHVTCHMSPVMCHMSGVKCHMSWVTCHIFFLQSDEAYRWGSVINGAYPVYFFFINKCYADFKEKILKKTLKKKP